MPLGPHWLFFLFPLHLDETKINEGERHDQTTSCLSNETDSY